MYTYDIYMSRGALMDAPMCINEYSDTCSGYIHIFLCLAAIVAPVCCAIAFCFQLVFGYIFRSVNTMPGFHVIGGGKNRPDFKTMEVISTICRGYVEHFERPGTINSFDYPLNDMTQFGETEEMDYDQM